MRHVGMLKSAVIWTVMTAGVSGAVVVFGGEGVHDPNAAGLPGHDATACRVCRTNGHARGLSLPYEIDSSVHFRYPEVVKSP